MTRVTRFLHILRVLTRYRLLELLPASRGRGALLFLLRLLPTGWVRRERGPRGERIRLALQALGPVFVKLGQVLSTRRDLLPDDIADELQKLQDQVAPFPGESARQIVEEALGEPVTRLFSRFDTEPLASASVAQVHAAWLPDQTEVIVKIIRPGIRPVIRKDLSLMYLFAYLLERWWSEGWRLHPREVVRDYDHTIMGELDLVAEGSNTSHLRRNFERSTLLYVPQVYWDFTRRNVLVMERIHGIPIGDTEALRARGTNMKVLAERGVEIFFTQVFRDSFFHADMHPGNIFVNVDDPERPQYIAVDCGIVGSLTNEDQYYLARNLLAFFKRDYRQVAALHVESGWVPADTRVTEFEAAIRSVCEPIFERPLQDISFGLFLVNLFRTAQRFRMEVQPQLVLLQKTLLNIEGLGRQLYPQLDLWSTAHPFLEKWMQDRFGPQSFMCALQSHAPDWVEQIPALPQLATDALRRIRQLDQLAAQQQQVLNDLHRDLNRDRGVNWGLVTGSAFLLSAVAVASNFSVSLANTIPATSWVLALVGVWLLGRRRR